MKNPIPFGKYYLLDRINVGGMAEVFRATTYGVEGFEKILAIKRILPSIAEDSEFITMFTDEAKIAVQLNHTNIAQIYDLGVIAQSYFIAMEYVPGRDLRAIFERDRRLGERMGIPMACYIVSKICEGLDYAHRKKDAEMHDLNIVHRDVSPQNILVAYEGEIKLIDFGIAKAANKASKTQAGILKGKFGYMSPEQVKGEEIDRRSDIFSCGIILYEILTGERLFLGESDFTTLEKVRNVEIMPPSTFNKMISEDLETIILKALSKDPEERYQYANEFQEDLQRYLIMSNQMFSRKDLGTYMKKTFSKELSMENESLEHFRRLHLPKPSQPTGRTNKVRADSTAPVGELEANEGDEGEKTTLYDVARQQIVRARGHSSAQRVVPADAPHTDHDTPQHTHEHTPTPVRAPGLPARQATPRPSPMPMPPGKDPTPRPIRSTRETAPMPPTRVDIAIPPLFPETESTLEPRERTFSKKTMIWILVGCAVILIGAVISVYQYMQYKQKSRPSPFVIHSTAEADVLICSGKDNCQILGKIPKSGLFQSEWKPGQYQLLLRKKGCQDQHASIVVFSNKANAYTPGKLNCAPAVAAVIPEKGPGAINLDTIPPGARIRFLDKKYVKLSGTAPIIRRDLKPDTYKIRISHKDYFPRVIELQVKRGATIKITRTLVSKIVALEIGTAPQGATVVVRERATQKIILRHKKKTPTRVVLERRAEDIQYEVVLSKKRYQEVVKAIDFTGLKSQNLTDDPLVLEEVKKQTPVKVTMLVKKTPRRAIRKRPRKVVKKIPKKVVKKIPKKVVKKIPKKVVKKLPEIVVKKVVQYGKLLIGLKGAWAYVYINGRKIKNTPLINYKIRTGKHKIQLKRAELGIDIGFEVTVKPNKTTRVIKTYTKSL